MKIYEKYLIRLEYFRFLKKDAIMEFPLWLSSNHVDTGLIPGLTQEVKDLALPWLCCRPAALSLIGPLA